VVRRVRDGMGGDCLGWTGGWDQGLFCWARISALV